MEGRICGPGMQFEVGGAAAGVGRQREALCGLRSGSLMARQSRRGYSRVTSVYRYYRYHKINASA